MTIVVGQVWALKVPDPDVTVWAEIEIAGFDQDQFESSQRTAGSG